MLTSLNNIYIDDDLVGYVSSFSSNIYDPSGTQIGYIINTNEMHLFGYILFIDYFKNEVYMNDLLVGNIFLNGSIHIDNANLFRSGK